MVSKKRGYLRSGGAPGTDTAFEKGASLVNKELMEIYLPWKGFNGRSSNLVVKDKKAFEIAQKYHPHYTYLKQGAKKLQARNSHQVLGQDLCSKSDFVLCYTRSGGEEGGTGQAIRIANDLNIPIFNFGLYRDIEICRNEFMKFIEPYFPKKSA